MAQELFQIGIKGLIRNSKGEILMVYIPEWSGNQAHWDLPGGRMDPGESFLETLDRELQEEIGVSYTEKPLQLAAMLTSITIPAGDVRYPLVFVIYEVRLPADAKITLDPDSAEEQYGWFSPEEAAENMSFKFSEDFRELVRKLA